MKLIHHGGYNEQERDSYKEIIFSNTIQSMRYVLPSLSSRVGFSSIPPPPYFSFPPPPLASRRRSPVGDTRSPFKSVFVPH